MPRPDEPPLGDNERIRLLSDDLLLPEAVRFAEGKELQPSQIAGLLSFARCGLPELQNYVGHQADRNWPELRGGLEHPTKAFYLALKPKLDWIRQQVKEQGFVPEELTRAQRNARVNEVGGRLAAEFIQHLAAEMLYRSR